MWVLCRAEVRLPSSLDRSLSTSSKEEKRVRICSTKKAYICYTTTMYIIPNAFSSSWESGFACSVFKELIRLEHSERIRSMSTRYWTWLGEGRRGIMIGRKRKRNEGKSDIECERERGRERSGMFPPEWFWVKASQQMTIHSKRFNGLTDGSPTLYLSALKNNRISLNPTYWYIPCSWYVIVLDLSLTRGLRFWVMHYSRCLYIPRGSVN